VAREATNTLRARARCLTLKWLQIANPVFMAEWCVSTSPTCMPGWLRKPSCDGPGLLVAFSAGAEAVAEPGHDLPGGRVPPADGRTRGPGGGRGDGYPEARRRPGPSESSCANGQGRADRWIASNYREVKNCGRGVRILPCLLPTRSPWLNAIEPKWTHSKRKVVEGDGVLSAYELAARVCVAFGCTHYEHLSIPENVA